LATGMALCAFCPAALAAKPSTAAYVVDSNNNTVLQYSVAANGTLTADTPDTVATGLGPVSLVLSPNGKSAYVANQLASETTPSDQGTVSQYDVAANGTLTPKTPATVYTGALPLAVAASPDGKSVYVLCGDTSFNPATGTSSPNQIDQFNVGADGTLSPKTPAVVNIGLGQVEGLVVSPDGKNVYALAGRADSPPTSYAAPGSVRQFSVAANGTLTPKTPAYVLVGPTPTSIAVAPNGSTLYVANTDFGSYDGGIGSISQFAITANGTLTPDVPATVATGTSFYDPNSFPDYIAVNPNGHSMLVLTAGFPPSAILRYGIAANGTLSPSPKSIPFGNFPLDAPTASAEAYNADGTHAYVANESGGGFVAGSGYPIGSNGPPVVTQYTSATGDTLAFNSPQEVFAGLFYGAGNSFPYEIVLNNQPQLDGSVDT
jgi:6-phosphogluconolactonase (cycloisomerase 2 family)